MSRNIVVMGVAGSGKSVIGAWLADQIGRSFHDGDDFHPEANVQKMARGEPLDDGDRAGWLARLADLLTTSQAENSPIVLACSSLKAAYREQLSAGGRSLFLFLDVPRDVAEARLESRTGHFMPASLVQSQFETLEKPTDAIYVNNDRDLTVVQREILERVGEALNRQAPALRQ